MRHVITFCIMLHKYTHTTTNLQTENKRTDGLDPWHATSRARKDDLIVLRFKNCQGVRAKTLIMGQIHVIPVVLATWFPTVGTGLGNKDTFNRIDCSWPKQHGIDTTDVDCVLNMTGSGANEVIRSRGCLSKGSPLLLETLRKDRLETRCLSDTGGWFGKTVTFRIFSRNSLKKEASGFMGFGDKAESLRIGGRSLMLTLELPWWAGLIGRSWALWGVTGRTEAIGELIELMIGDEWSGAGGISFKLSKVLIWSTATCAEASIVKFGRWITSSNSAICVSSVETVWLLVKIYTQK